MSAWAKPRLAPVAVRRAPNDEQPGPLGVRLLTFFAVTAMAALAYARLLYHAPAGAALAVAAVATACGAALSLGLAKLGGARPADTMRLRARTARAAVIVAASLLGLELGLLAVGVPAHLVPPWRWGALASAVGGGLAQLGSWSWPYLGGAHWARLSVLMLLVPATTLMALLYFWPVRAGAGARRLYALAIAVALALCGMANTPPGAWRAQGLVLLLLVFAWLWLPTLHSSDAARAFAWSVACAVAALVAAPVLSGSHPWIPFTSGEASGPAAYEWGQVSTEFMGTPATLFGPIKASHSQQPTLLAVRASDPSGLLRVTSLDRFDGLRFIRSDAPPETAATDVRAGAQASWYESATIGVERLRSNLLVGASGITQRVTWHGHQGPVGLQRASDGTLSLSVPLAAGTSYTVLSYAPKPTPSQMRAAPRTFPRSYEPYTELELPLASASALHAPQLAREASSPLLAAQLVRPPAFGTGEATATRGGSAAAGASTVARRILASPYGPMYALARRLAAGARSSYEVVAHIERYLLAGYTYSEQPPLRRYPLEAFLFADRRGYCQQFSGAMTLMLRMDGIPARVGVGFNPVLVSPARPAGPEQLIGEASALDAHAWVEVFFSGTGWVPFDPTPPTSTARSGANRAASKAVLLGTLSITGGEARTRVPPEARELMESWAVRAHGSHAGGPAAGAHTGGGSSLALAPWQWALLALVPAVALGAWLRARAARAPHAGARAARAAGIDTAVRELERALHGSAWPLPPGMTLTQIAERLERVAQPRAAAYVRRLRDRRFGRTQALTTSELSAARSERLALRRALAHGRGLRGRLRALRLLPPHAPSL
jgi:transglutaminase-like putative cysteine protease